MTSLLNERTKFYCGELSSSPKSGESQVEVLCSVHSTLVHMKNPQLHVQVMVLS